MPSPSASAARYNRLLTLNAGYVVPLIVTCSGVISRGLVNVPSPAVGPKSETRWLYDSGVLAGAGAPASDAYTAGASNSVPPAGATPSGWFNGAPIACQMT